MAGGTRRAGARRKVLGTRPITQSSVIDQAGQLVLRNLLTRERGWLLRTEQIDGSDIHIDFACERIESQRPSGHVIRIQLKTVTRARIRNGLVACRLPSAHFSYYSARCRMPVFIVLVCKATNSAYWLFAQQYAREARSDPWQKRNSITVHMPIGSNLAMNGEFTAAVAAAGQYMQSLFPGTIGDAVASEENRLASENPGWNFKVSVDRAGRKEIQLDPHAPVTGKISLTTGQGRVGIERLRDFVTGRRITLAREDIEIVGLPVDSIAGSSSSTVTIASGLERYGIAWLRRNGEGVPVLGIPVRTMTQFGGLSFEPSHLGEPIALSGVTVVEGIFGPAEKDLSEINLSFDLTSWVGRSVRRLPYLAILAALSDAAKKEERMDVHLQIDGLLGKISSFSPSAVMSPWLSSVIRAIGHADRICNELDVEMELPPFDSISDLDVLTCEAIDAALTSGSGLLREIGVATEIVAGEFTPGQSMRLNEDGDLRLSAFGTQISLPQYCLFVSAMDIREADGRRMGVSSPKGEVWIVRMDRPGP